MIMSNPPFDPGTRGWDALRLVRESSGSAGASAHRSYYASMIHLREQVCGELWSAEASVEEGKRHLMQGQLEQAVTAFQQAMLIGTPDRDVLYLLGAAWYELGEYNRAEWMLSILVANVPDHARGQYMLSLVYRELDRWDDVTEALKKAVDADPTHADACYLLANCHSLGGDHQAKETAVDLYRQALDASPNHEGSLYNMGQTLLWLGRLDEAKDIYDSLLPISESHALMLRDSMESDVESFSMVCAMIGGFKATCGVWPSRLHLRSYLMRAMRSRLGTNAFEELSRKIGLIELGQGKVGIQRIRGRGELGVAEGGKGQVYEYPESTLGEDDADLLREVEHWLDARPGHSW